MKKLTGISILLGFCLVACSAPGTSSTPATDSSASPDSSSPSANPAASSSPSSAPTEPVSGKATLESMKAASVCLKASGATGESIASGIDARIAIAEQMIQSGNAEFAQGQLDIAYSQGNEVESQYGLDCIK